MNDHRTALFIREQRLSASTNQNQEGTPGLLLVPPQANVNTEDDDGHSPISAVLRRRAERRERGDSQDGIPFDSDPMNGPSGGDLQNHNLRTRQPLQETKQLSYVSFSVPHHSQDGLYPPAIVSDMQAPRSTASKSLSSQNASSDFNTAPLIRSSSPISYTPKGTPPPSAPIRSFRSPGGRGPNGGAALSPLDLGALPTHYTTSSLFRVVLSEDPSSRPNMVLGPINHKSSTPPNSLVSTSAVIRPRPSTSTASPSFLERTRRNVSISVHPASPIEPNSKAHREKVTETNVLPVSPKHQNSSTSAIPKSPTRGLPISAAHLATAYLDANKYSDGSKFGADNTTGNGRHALENAPRDEIGASTGDRKFKTKVDGVRTTRGRAGQESKPQPQTGKGVDPHAKQGAYAEASFLDAVEDLRAETREALIGIHVDIIKARQAWKVS